MKDSIIRFIDLFAGIGGIRCGLEQAIIDAGYKPVCVFTSEIKPYAIDVLTQNHPDEEIHGDITKISSTDIPDFDILCAGFPCQAFSSAGKRQGFADTRGTLFFEVERILKEKNPNGFILENVEGLVNHDNGKTFKIILERLNNLGYNVSYKILNSKNFGVPQERKRIYIVGIHGGKISLDAFHKEKSTLKSVLENGKPTSNTKFIKLLLNKFNITELYGKSIKDKRGGKSNIHSWDLDLKGEIPISYKEFLNTLLKERRRKEWANLTGITWMDGMPLTVSQIKHFYKQDNLTKMLDELVSLGYLKLEHPKKLITEKSGISHRVYDVTKEMGYNIVTGKLSFEVNKVLDPNDVAPTLVAMDMQKLYVVDNNGLRRLTLREGLRLFGYPDNFIFNVSEKDGYDLLGNTVVVPVIKAVASRLINKLTENKLL
jgi:DNA (cytosine-5)-methyltransferase 1